MSESLAPTKHPPGPPGLSVIGHLPQLTSNPLGFMRGLATTYGPVARYYLGAQPVVLYSRPDAVAEILIKRTKSLSVAEYNHVLRPILGRGLFTTDGLEHAQLRRLVQPAFVPRRIASYRDIMIAHVERMLTGWRLSDTVDVGIAMRRLTLGIIAEVLVSIQRIDEADVLGGAIDGAARLNQHRWLANAFLVIEQSAGKALKASGLSRLRPESQEPGDTLDSLSRGPLSRLPGTPLHRLAQVRHTIDGVLFPIISERRARGGDTGDVLSSLLLARDQDVTLSDQAIRDQLITLLVAGYGTTAVAVTWALYLLSINPRVAVTLRAELKRVLGGAPVGADDTANLPYLDQVWNETLRLYPPGWALGRFCCEDIEAAGYRVPAGTLLMVSPWVTHRLPELFKDPQRFIPERFDPVDGERHPPYAYFPFGAGPHVCLGNAFAALEGKVLLASILQHCDPQVVSGLAVSPKPSVVLVPSHGMHMTLRPVA